MPRTKVTDEQKKKARQKASNKFHKEHMKVYTFRFHKENQRDIIEHLESQKNKAGYIADLIRKDLIAQGKQPFERVRVCDVVNEINDDDEIILVFKDGSKMSVSKEDIANDERYIDSISLDETSDTLKHIIQVRYS